MNPEHEKVDSPFFFNVNKNVNDLKSTSDDCNGIIAQNLLAGQIFPVVSPRNEVKF